MLTPNYTYRIYPDPTEQQVKICWLETYRQIYNHALGELNDWIALPKCPIDRCSLEKEYIIWSDGPFPRYQRQQNDLPKAKKEKPPLSEVHSQLLQTTIRRLHDTWDGFYWHQRWENVTIVSVVPGEFLTWMISRS